MAAKKWGRWKRYSGDATIAVAEGPPEKGEKRAFAVTIAKRGYASTVKIAIVRQSKPPGDQQALVSRIARSAIEVVLQGEWPKRTEDWSREDFAWTPAVSMKPRALRAAARPKLRSGSSFGALRRRR